MKTRIFLFYLLFLFLSFNGTNPVFGAKSKKSLEIVILHTNDMHAKIDNFGKLAYLVDSIKALHKHVFLVAAGDNFTGNPIVDMYPDKGFPMIDLMNKVGFNLSALGNHEFDLGQELLNKRRKEAGFPFICANINVTNSKLIKPDPYFVLKAGKYRIPFLGLIQLGENGLPDSHPSRLVGIGFSPAEETAKNYMWLKDRYGMLIGLTHLGIEGDEPLAQKFPQFDVIIGGHSHTLMTKPMMVNNVMIVQTGSGLRSVGMTTLLITKGKITDRKYELIALSSVKGIRKDVQEAIDKYNDNAEMNRTIAVAEKALKNEEELGSLMTDAITHRFKIDFAFQNSGGIRIPSLPQGDIKYKDIFRLDPFGNQVVTFTLTLPEIRSLIRNSFNRNKEIDLYVSGMNYTVIIDENGICTDVEMTDKSGNPLDPDKKYTVGMNSYIAASYKFDHSDPGTTNFETCSQTLTDFLTEVKSVNYEGVKRAHVRKR